MQLIKEDRKTYEVSFIHSKFKIHTPKEIDQDLNKCHFSPHAIKFLIGFCCIFLYNYFYLKEK